MHDKYGLASITIGLITAFFVYKRIASHESDYTFFAVLFGMALIFVIMITHDDWGMPSYEEIRAKERQREAEERQRENEIRRQEEKEKEQNRLQGNDPDLARQIYKKCKQKGLRSIDSENDISNLLIITRSLGISDREIAKKYFSFGKGLIDSDEESAAKKRELESHQENKRKAYIKGVDKYISDLDKQYQEALKDAERYEDYARSSKDLAQSYEFVNSAVGSLHTNDKDKNWAVAGGIAEAIAGPAAGLATAISVQNENAQRHRDAEERKRKAAYRTSEAEKLRNKASDERQKAWEYKSKALQIKRDIDRIKSKLVDDSNQQELFGLLSFDNWTLLKTQAGNIDAKCSFHLQKPITIINSPAALDGSLKIELYMDSRIVGTGYYCPFGFGETDLNMVGFRKGYLVRSICILNSNTRLPDNFEDRITVKVTPINMWKIEI